MEGFTPKQKLIFFICLTIGVSAICAYLIVAKLADTGYLDSEDIKKIKIIAKQKSSARVIINNIGSGTVTYHGKDWTAEEIVADKKRIDSVDIARFVAMDGVYKVDSCKLEGGLHLISTNGKALNPDLEYLDESKRKELLQRVAEALLNQKKIDIKFRIDAKIKSGVVIRSHIIDIDQEPRTESMLEDIPIDPKSHEKSQPVMQQGNLLDIK